MRLPSGERREWVKPIMFTAGLGSMDASHTDKMAAEKGMLIAKIGGPAYRIGMGGGAASSVDVQGDADRDADLDFNAVQRGDAEMEHKMNRAVRACIEMGDKNPICSIHDQGAGGNGNVLKEICEPAGALIKVKVWGHQIRCLEPHLLPSSCRVRSRSLPMTLRVCCLHPLIARFRC